MSNEKEQKETAGTDEHEVTLLCPFRGSARNAGVVGSPCLSEGCELWNPVVDRCSFFVIGVALTDLVAAQQLPFPDEEEGEDVFDTGEGDGRFEPDDGDDGEEGGEGE